MKNPTLYLKLKVLGAIDFAEGKTQRERIRNVSQSIFKDEDGRPCRFTWRTIETWLVRYRKNGITGMNPKPRRDKGKRRKIEPERVLEAIEQALPLFRGRSYNIAQLYRTLIEKGLLRREELAPNTFRRIVKQYEMLQPEANAQNKKRLAFSKQYANQMWQADTMFGPYLKNKQTKLIAFIDDASRVLCHGEFFFQENTEALIQAFRGAFYKRGVPEQIYVDNGSIYSSKEITLICARLGIILSHAPVRDGAAKGKIERFFRTLRGQFLTRQLDLSSLAGLNRQFNEWVEKQYNSKTHSTIGMTPIDRFGLDLKRLRFLPADQDNDEFFFLEESRTVKNDNTFSLSNIRFEAPCDLRGKKIQVRFDRNRMNRIVVFYKEQRLGEARPLDRIANDRPPKKEPGEQS